MKTFAGILLLLLAVHFHPFAQKIDSLKSVISSLPDDTSKINFLISSAKGVLNSNPEQAYQWSEECAELSKRLNSETGLARSLKVKADYNRLKGNYNLAIDLYRQSNGILEGLGDIYSASINESLIASCFVEMGNFSEARKILEDVLKKAEGLGDKNLIGSLYIRLSNAWHEEGDINKSLEFSFKAATIMEETKDQRGLASVYNNMASDFKDLKDYSNSLKYHQLALEIKKKIGEKRSIAITYSNMGTLYRNMNDYGKALEYLNLSMNLRKEIGDRKGISQDLQNIGIVYRNQKKYEAALKNYMESLAIKKEIKDLKGEAIIYFNTAQLMVDQEKANEAVKYLNKSEKIALEVNSKDLLADIFSLRSQALELGGSQKEAIEALKKSIAMNDSIMNIERSKQIIELQTKYETEKKDRDLLQNKLTLQQKEAEIQKKNSANLILTISIAALALLLIFGTGYFIQRQRAIKQRDELEKQKAIVTERNRIASDMHDDLGSGLSKIKLLGETMQVNNNGNSEELNKISRTAGELADSMRQIIWAMGSNNDTLEDLVLYVRKYAYEFFEGTGITLHFPVPENIPEKKLSPEARRNIFLVIKESLNNSLKHSRATDVTIHTGLDGGIFFSIRDNGKGFSSDVQNRFGNGLLNMKKRIESIGGKFTVTSTDGTTVTFNIPEQTEEVGI